jgi:hypothetical protein
LGAIKHQKAQRGPYFSNYPCPLLNKTIHVFKYILKRLILGKWILKNLA